jgi:hypothetical protein
VRASAKGETLGPLDATKNEKIEDKKQDKL